MLVNRDINDEIIHSFRTKTSNIEEKADIPAFSDLQGAHNTTPIVHQSIIGEKTTSTEHPNTILYKINIGNFIDNQKSAISTFARIILSLQREINKITYNLELSNDPYNCYAHFLIEFLEEQEANEQEAEVTIP